MECDREPRRETFRISRYNPRLHSLLLHNILFPIVNEIPASYQDVPSR